ncbi:MAG TPA: hypothetical protein VKE70_08070 [Candidatus Solibacter sp.]|nr:hypothetical protein [Candidatus Solibacter sp.]
MATLKSSYFSRRAFASTLAGAALAKLCRAAEPAGLERLSWSADRAPALNLERRYRADAQVLLLGLQLLHRENVGGGSVLWREFKDGSNTRLLEFNGFSAPERAAGLNRLGFIREMVRSAPDRGGECIYFGLMTASPEESADEARKALHSTTKEQIYSAIDGRIGSAEAETTTARFTAPAGVSGRQSAELVQRARRALESAHPVVAPHPAHECCQSFLQTLAAMLESPGRNEGRYFYSGRPYRIRLSRSADPKATAQFRERGLLAASAEAIRVTGKVRREAGGKETDFRLWIPTAAERPLPLRIEYQPRSYLRLTFEAVASE